MITTASSSSLLAAFNFTWGIVPSLIVVRAEVAARSTVFLLGGTTDGSRLRAHDFSLSPPHAARVLSSVRLCCGQKREGARARRFVCGITFELSWHRRWDARPGLAKMYRVPPDRAWWPAVGAPLERGVMPHSCEVRKKLSSLNARHGSYPVSADGRAGAVPRRCGKRWGPAARCARRDEFRRRRPLL